MSFENVAKVGFGVLFLSGLACATAAVPIDDVDASTPTPDSSTCSGTCGGKCVDLKTDNVNCGKCGNACPATATCVAGSCQCAQGQNRCGNACVDTKTDLNNCGKCGQVCGTGDGGAIMGGGTWVCAAGACSVQCPMMKSVCTNTCVDTMTDINNCGMCNTACDPALEACAMGKCCPQGQVNCAGACVDTQSDPKNCGVCGMACSGMTPGCSKGMCAAFVDHGPMHTFANLTTDHYVTQGGCSKGQGDAVDAAYFCTHFYGNNCTPLMGYAKHTCPNPTYGKMHKNGGCTSMGTDIPNTTCDSGACKIGNWSEVTQGLNNIVCRCL